MPSAVVKVFAVFAGERFPPAAEATGGVSVSIFERSASAVQVESVSVFAAHETVAGMAAQALPARRAASAMQEEPAFPDVPELKLTG